MPNYLYNGVELPLLPEWDKTAYPYAVIRYTNLLMRYELLLFSEFNYRTTSSGIYVVGNSAGNAALGYFAKEAGEKWSYFDNTLATVEVNAIKWSNHDILNSDGTLYLAASEPVPIVQHVTESKGDGYALYNGVKVLASEVPDGAESIPLDGMNVIEWDGNSEDMEMAALFYAKLSDCVPTVEEVANSVIVCVYGEEERVIDQPIVFVESDMPEGSYMLGETGEDGDPVCFILGLAKEMETEEEVVPIGLYSASYGDYLYNKLLAYTPATTEEPEEPAPTPPSPQTAFCIGKAFGRLIRDSISAQST